jgi:hypothetical protein
LEVLDKLVYRFFGFLDDAIAFVETGAIKFTEWCWHSRVNLLHKRRKKNVERRTSNIK